MVSYLSQLTLSRLVLWNYLLWYVVTVARYFDPSPALWVNSVGISAVIGTALYLSTAHGGRSRTRLEPWQIFRLYLSPFCVSSYAALIKDRGFVLVFHPSPRDNLSVFLFLGAFSGTALLLRRHARERASLRLQGSS